MKKFVSFVFALALSISLAIPAAATISPPGGVEEGDIISPKTGSSTVAVLALTACAAAGAGAVSYKKNKE